MISLRQVTLRRGTEKLIEGLDLRIPAGQRMGIVGRNGTGKSSLFALLLGELSPDTGDVDVPANLDLATVRQEAPAGRQAAQRRPDCPGVAEPDPGSPG